MAQRGAERLPGRGCAVPRSRRRPRGHRRPPFTHVSDLDNAFTAEHAEFDGSSTGPSAPGLRRSTAVRNDAEARGAAPGQRVRSACAARKRRGGGERSRNAAAPSCASPSVRPLQFL